MRSHCSYFRIECIHLIYEHLIYNILTALYYSSICIYHNSFKQFLELNIKFFQLLNHYHKHYFIKYSKSS